MSWIATDNFDSYTLTADLNGGSGGTNWSGNWTKVGSGAITIATPYSGGQGGNSPHSTITSGNAYYERTISSFSDGTFSIQLYTTAIPTTSTDAFGFSLIGASGGVATVYMDRTGIFTDNPGGAGNNFGSASASTWYTVDVDFDATNQANKFRVRLNGGSWSSWVATATNTPVTKVRIANWRDFETTANDSMWDDIKNGGVVATAAFLLNMI